MDNHYYPLDNGSLHQSIRQVLTSLLKYMLCRASCSILF